MLAELPVGKVDKDAKTKLQEWLQARQFERPEYTLISSTGEEHARVFLVQCSITDPPFSAEGEGSSLRTAEQAAAALVLAQIEVARK
jgi:ribonuclease-3